MLRSRPTAQTGRGDSLAIKPVRPLESAARLGRRPKGGRYEKLDCTEDHQNIVTISVSTRCGAPNNSHNHKEKCLTHHSAKTRAQAQQRCGVISRSYHNFHRPPNLSNARVMHARGHMPHVFHRRLLRYRQNYRSTDSPLSNGGHALLRLLGHCITQAEDSACWDTVLRENNREINSVTSRYSQ